MATSNLIANFFDTNGYSSAIKFIHQSNEDIKILSEKIHSDYDELVERFKYVCKGYLSSSFNRRSAATKVTQVQSLIDMLDSDLRENKHQVIVNLKLRHKEQDENATKPTTSNADLSVIKKKTKRKKKAHSDSMNVTTASNIQTDQLITDLKDVTDLISSTNNFTKLTIKKETASCSFVSVASDVDKVKKKKKKKKDSSMLNDTKNETTTTIIRTEVTVEKQPSLSKKVKKSSSKRLKQTEGLLETLREDETDNGQVKLSKKSKLAKISSSSNQDSTQIVTASDSCLFRIPAPLAQSSLSMASTSLQTKPSQTPLKQKISAIQNELAESNSKTLKPSTNQQQNEAKPMTRRAAAAAAAAAVVTEQNIQDNLCKSSGKVKQMVEMVEARMNLGTPSSSAKSNIHKSAVSRQLLYSTTKAKQQASAQPAKLRSSIDNRKMRMSNSKQKAEQKRQSIKKVNAFLKDIASSATNDSQSSQSTFNHDETMTSNSTATSSILGVTSTVKKCPINLANNPTVQQQYKLAVDTLAKGTPMSSQSSVMRKSFVKFLERNTPLKMNLKELEDKRKMELMLKEKKEQERKQERDKQMQDKIEISKKKREEKMRKIVESKVKKQEDDLRRKEELDAKLKEVEENKKRLLEEKRREEYEKQKAREQRLAHGTQINHLNVPSSSVNHHQTSTATQLAKQAIVNSYSNTHQIKAMLTGQKTPSKQQAVSHSNYHNTLTKQINTPSSNNLSSYEQLSTFKSSQQIQQHQSTVKQNPLQQIQNTPKLTQPQSVLETTYSKPISSNQHPPQSNQIQPPQIVLKPCTPKPVSKKPNTFENYDIADLKSEDETDDEEEPSKPIPQWAKDVTQRAIQQGRQFVNFTKLFKAATSNEINLDEIFTIKRRKFYERSSSANWSSPPIWRTNGISGNESFRRMNL